MEDKVFQMSCAAFDAQAETIAQFFSRFEVQMSDALHKTRNHTIRQAAILLRALPVAMITDIQVKIAPVELKDATYDEIKSNLLESYTVKKSVIGAAVHFFTSKQEQGQTIEEYSKKIKSRASQCGFDQQISLNRILRDVFVAGSNSAPVLSTIMESADSMTFEESVEKAKLIQQIREDTAVMQRPANIHVSTTSIQDTTELNQVTRKVPENYKCARCGQVSSHFVDQCFAISLTCRLCKKFGHIAKVCRSSRRSNNNLHQVNHQESTNEDQINVVSVKRKQTGNKRSSPNSLHATTPKVVQSGVPASTLQATPSSYSVGRKAASGMEHSAVTHTSPPPVVLHRDTVTPTPPQFRQGERSTCDGDTNDISHFLY